MAESRKIRRTSNQRISHHGGVRDVLMVVRSQTEGSLPRKSQQPPKKKIDIWEPVAEVKRSPPMGLRSLVLAPFLISSFLAENCRMRSLNTDSQFWLIWGYPHLRKRPCATKTSDVSIESHRIHAARFGPPKKWAWPNSSLISISAPRFRKTFVAAILVKTSSTPQNLRSKFQDSTPNPWYCAFVARIYQFLDAQF